MRRAFPGALVALLAATAGQAAPGVPDPEVTAFDLFVARGAAICEREPSRRCVALGFGFADTDGDGRISLPELQAVKRALRDWTAWKRDALTAGERTTIALGLGIVDLAGLPRLFASFDADGDGRLSREELLADVTLDERPLGAVLIDPDAVDRRALASRVGAVSPLLEGLLGGAGKATR